MEQRWTKNIRRIRKEKKVTQVQLAEKLGVTQSYVSQIERGYVQNPSVRTIENFAKALGVDIVELFAN